MNREFLKGLGLDDEAVNKAMAEHGKAIESQKSKVAELQASNEDLAGQLTQRDSDLKELQGKAKGNEELQTQLTELQSKYDTEKTEFATRLKDTQLSGALKLALAGKVHDADLVAGLIDKATIELGEEGNITKGLDEQIKTLQESKSFLFVPEKDETNTLSGAKPLEGNQGEPKPFDPFAAKLEKYQ
ncbi:phage scaffolding protein [Sporosarcina sp. CAU 1771]